MFKIHTAKITQFGPSAVIVTTSFKNEGGYFNGESFVIFPDPHGEKVFKAIRFEEKGFIDTSVELNDEFVLNELLNQAFIDIGIYIQKHYAENPFLISPGELQITDSDLVFLVHKQVRGEADFLVDIINKTDCDELRERLNPITSLQRLSNRKIN